MNILETIIAHKRQEVAERQSLYPAALLERSIYFSAPTVSLRSYLLRPDKSGVIAEFKRASPSKGDINRFANARDVSIGYMQAGASALSVLTDSKFFKGSSDDLTTVRRFNYCPVLRKDFVVDPYQLIEARSIGADAVLLIAEVLTQAEVKDLSERAHDLGLEVLLEVHSAEQLDKVGDAVDCVGVNNRNLETFQVSLQTSVELANQIPGDKVRISESGIQSAEDAAMLRRHGYQGFLIGEMFMRTADPAQTAAKFMRDLNELNENAEEKV